MGHSVDTELVAASRVPAASTFAARLRAACFKEKREHGRFEYRVPVLLSDSAGVTDYSVTEDVSRGGFSFSSERFYIPGEIVSASIRWGDAGETTRVTVRIVRREDLGETGFHTYGVCHLRPSDPATSN